ncbi:hypothetical protein ROLI_026930 [Roseobacter fucihabitans]|uniref:Glycoside hydrolase family 19 catalytic domain-containing protein n=1 Tax=Roseobacter fucihabitans TaxID=1537242 RepID=A0ABZ2BW35_9RHOB|nr:hypothetical protein [Roseobacter litoralis]MBC6967187.1 hypothetical protein [Roseobacter litoralis]
MKKIDRKAFFDTIRQKLFGGTLSTTQVTGITTFLDYWEKNYGDADDRWLAYVLATAHHEVNQTFTPISEYGGDKYFFRMYDIEGDRPHVAKRLGNLAKGDGVLFHGRGFVQLTGRSNYAFWEKRVPSGDLTSNRAAADRVLEVGIATEIIFEGMVEGTFTGKKLADYIANVKQDYVNARRIINGVDKADLIAGYAKSYNNAISYETSLSA